MLNNFFVGRINRKGFILGNLLGIVIIFIALGIITLLTASLGVTFSQTVATLFLTILYILLGVFFISLIIRRFHDLGKSGWMTLLTFIPLVGIVILVYLMFAKGVTAAPPPQAPSPQMPAANQPTPNL